MAQLNPFLAWRPAPEHVLEVVCPPYDVISVAEARALADGKTQSFLRVVRPEVDLPDGIDEHDDAVYAQGARNLIEFCDGGILHRDPERSLYIWRLRWRGRDQIGLFGCVAVADYDAGTIVRHEQTRVDKEDDRTRHILTQRAHAEPVMLTYRDTPSVDALVAEAMAAPPLYSFESFHGVEHAVWPAPRPSEFVAAFAEVERLYVADGHHRCKASSRAAAAAGADGETGWFPAVLFPMSHMQILPYHRVIKKVPGGVDALLATLKDRFGLVPADVREPVRAGIVQACVAVGGIATWFTLALPATARHARADRLDVALLDEHVLQPLIGIGDPRTDPNIAFVGGIRGPDELERTVVGGQGEIAFAMFPTSISDLVEVSDAGELMPPKSTWFEPKLISGLLVHRF